MGYVVNRQDRWYAVNYEGMDPLTGRDRRRWHPAVDEATARTLAAALPAARTHSSALHGMTLARFMRTRWLPACDGRLRPTTSFRYRQMTERYVLPHLGRVPLRRLTIVHLERLYPSCGPAAVKTASHSHPRRCSTCTRSFGPRSGTPSARDSCRATSRDSWIRRVMASRRSSDAGTTLSYAPSSTWPLSTGSARRCG
jgi:hypothetical protein